jgi:K+-transporting ATPase A subunit
LLLFHSANIENFCQIIIIYALNMSFFFLWGEIGTNNGKIEHYLLAMIIYFCNVNQITIHEEDHIDAAGHIAAWQLHKD